MRITAPDVPVPFNGTLEARYVPTSEDVSAAITEIVTNNKVLQPWWIQKGLNR